jgi:hypothetical protein
MKTIRDIMNAKNFIRCKNRALSHKQASYYAAKISLWLQKRSSLKITFKAASYI